METILRKVKSSNRSPYKSDVYFVENHSHKLFFDVDLNKWHNFNFTDYKVEYWYEEVSIDELDEYKMLMKSNLHLREMNAKLQEDDTNLASERFEKAKKILIDRNYIRTSIKYIEQALRVAAGLQEEVKTITFTCNVCGAIRSLNGCNICGAED